MQTGTFYVFSIIDKVNNEGYTCFLPCNVKEAFCFELVTRQWLIFRCLLRNTLRSLWVIIHFVNETRKQVQKSLETFVVKYSWRRIMCNKLTSCSYIVAVSVELDCFQDAHNLHKARIINEKCLHLVHLFLTFRYGAMQIRTLPFVYLKVVEAWQHNYLLRENMIVTDRMYNVIQLMFLQKPKQPRHEDVSELRF